MSPKVHIIEPQNGSHFTNPEIAVKGTISNYDGSIATLYLNGIDRVIPLDNGSFNYILVLESGENKIRVEAENEYGTGYDEITVYYDSGEVEVLWIELTWDKDLADMDLYVYEPDGKVVWWSNMWEHGRLDYDDRDGYGPEHYTLTRSNAISGEYRIRVHYYDTNGQTDPVTCKVVVKKYGTEVLNKTFTLVEASPYNSDPNDSGSDWYDVGSVILGGALEILN